MENVKIRKKIKEFLETEKSGDGKNVSKPFKENLEKFITDIVFDAVKEAEDNFPLDNALSGAVGYSDSLTRFIGKELYYVIFKQVRSQVKGSLQLRFGWQFTVLRGKADEIQIRNDHGILFKINGDWVLKDHVFDKEVDAKRCCATLNMGTDVLAVEKKDTEVVQCACCNKFVNVNETQIIDGKYVCNDCVPSVVDDVTEEVEVDGKAETTVANVDNGHAEVGVEAEGKAD